MVDRTAYTSLGNHFRSYTLCTIRGDVQNGTKFVKANRVVEFAARPKIVLNHSSLVESVTVSRQVTPGQWLVEFVLKNESVDTFDYLTDQPSKLIVDFYMNDKLKNDLIGVARPNDRCGSLRAFL